MQQDFDSNSPELGIQIIGINEFGEESGNSLVTEELPWLQDVEASGDSAWQLWNVEWRDLTILDRNNVPVTTFNLTTFDLADPANYEAVRQAFLSAAAQEANGEGEAHTAVVDRVFAQIEDWVTV